MNSFENISTARILLDATYDRGRFRRKGTVRVIEDLNAPGYINRFEVFVDGEQVIVARASRLRDGGTTTIETSVGTIRVPRRAGVPQHLQIPTLNGMKLVPR